jgi:hypothetical protein
MRVLANLPGSLDEAGPFVSRVLAGNPPDLLAENVVVQDAWPGFSRTAGVGYSLGDEPIPPLNQPLETGIVLVGGIPALDQALRPEVYQQGGPVALNMRAVQALNERGVPSAYYDGSYAENVYAVEQASSDVQIVPSEVPVEPVVVTPPPPDQGIFTTPTPNG